MFSRSISRLEYFVTFIVVLFASVVVYQIMSPIFTHGRKMGNTKAKEQLKKIGKEEIELTEYEEVIASHLTCPEDIHTSWNDIAGIDDVLGELRETVIFPISEGDLFTESSLTRPPKGVLLYGPPGCGKTLIAKATAKEANVAFINLDLSILTNKMYGASQKLVTALFDLAYKLQPCIIFIDEIDSLLRERRAEDHEATAMMKAQFMFLWDGLITDPSKTVIVMGATNRPQDLDPAIIRRMPAIFEIPLPNEHQRTEIMKLILKNEKTLEMDYEYLAKKTEQFSGSDLKELCRKGSSYRVREVIKIIQEERQNNNKEKALKRDRRTLREITMDDMKNALQGWKRKELFGKPKHVCHHHHEDEHIKHDQEHKEDHHADSKL